MDDKIKSEKRRSFLKTIGLGTVAAGIGSVPVQVLASEKETGKITLEGWLKGRKYEPLQTLTLNSSVKGFFKVYDAAGNLYNSSTKETNSFSFQVGGALGTQYILLVAKDGKVNDTFRFTVDTATRIKDSSGTFNKLMEITKGTLYTYDTGGLNFAVTLPVFWNGELYKIFAHWFQDNYYIFKGLKYYEKDVKGYMDFFGDTQSKEGMIFDHVEEIKGYSSWANRFEKEFVAKPEKPQSNVVVIRTPVENMGEYTFLESLYYVWKATGDTDWMIRRLENALRALKFSQTSPYYWSEKYQLMKRGHTIDFWDYQPTEDADRVGGDIMDARLGVTRFSIMFGDNLRMARSCELLSEMLTFCGRKEEAKKVLEFGLALRERIEKLSWNGNFFTHQTPEDPNVKRDFGGTDEKKQVVLSNTYALNANISHDKCVSIIKTYQRIRNEMPKSSPGEWYLCYPPFETGYGNNPKWEYMNGGVSPIAGGELAHGAFWHGFEKYGVDILKRIKATAEAHNDHIENTYKGYNEPKKKVNYKTVSLKPVANAGFSGKPVAGALPWTNEGDNDFAAFPVGKQTFESVPFDITDPASNNGKACLILSYDKDYPLSGKLNINAKSPYVCILHASGGNLQTGGLITINYKDGTKVHDYITADKVGNWWMPNDRRNWKVAWRGSNARSMDIGAGIYTLKNMFPEKEITFLEFETIKTKARWMILGITLADNDPELFKTDLSYGIPDNWAAGAVAFALVEGLAGIKDLGLGFDESLLAPRWAATEESAVEVVAKYESSGGYNKYQYQLKNNVLTLTFTGNAVKTSMEVLLPEGKKALQAKLDGKPVQLKEKQVESSNYVMLEVNGVGVHTLEIII